MAKSESFKDLIEDLKEPLGKLRDTERNVHNPDHPAGIAHLVVRFNLALFHSGFKILGNVTGRKIVAVVVALIALGFLVTHI